MLRITDLVKKYGNITAVNSLSLTVEKGIIYGFLGPNGAGKTTTIMVVLGIIKPTKGEVKVAGSLIGNDSLDIKKTIGFVGDSQIFYEEMTAWEYLKFFGQLYEVENADNRALALLENVDLLSWKDMVIRGFSTGMKKKLSIVRSILHSPQLLILDEPVSGLDPFGILQIRELLLAEKKRGCTIVISSHLLTEIENTVDQVGIIDKGKIIAEGTIESLSNQIADTTTIELEIEDYSSQNSVDFHQLHFVRSVTTDGNMITLEIDKDQDYRSSIGKFIVQNELVLMKMERKQASLEDTFITITEKTLPQIAKNILEN